MFGQVVTETNVSLLFSGEFHNDHYYAWLSVEEKEFHYFSLSLFLKKAFAATFSLDNSIT
jgi:hypothetical protein